MYVLLYYKFEDGSSEQITTGWESVLDKGHISDYLELWKEQYSEEDGFTHGNTRVSLKGTIADEVQKEIYQTICNAAHDAGTWTNTSIGITYPQIDNNKSDDILDVETILLYLEDDDCDPTN